ncbi:MAG: hypothetical protein MUO43_00750 [Desulfobacterales bacterium]|jgi:hypothetical protein|nr:hypothetical protein [Desulfobacterales bacterium]
MGWNALSKEITVIVAGLFIALTSYLLVKMGIIVTSVAWLMCATYLLSVACICLYRRAINKNIQHTESLKTIICSIKIHGTKITNRYCGLTVMYLARLVMHGGRNK